MNAPLKFLGLLDKPAERGAAIIKMGLMMYDAYTGNERTVPHHEFLLHDAALKRYPQLNPEIVSVAEYYDGLIRAPERLCVELIADAEAVAERAYAVNYVSVVGASGGHVRLHDEISGESFDVQPQLVINAAGPWIDFANQAMGQETTFIGGTKGSHLVLDHPELRAAIGEHEFFFENQDGRIVLICPLEERVLIGTSDIRIDNPDQAICTDEEIDYFLGMTARVFPNITVDHAQIVFTFSGVRPLPAANAKSTGQISRDHSIEVIDPGNGIDFPVLNLIGGKWTTFRAFAEQTTDRVLARLGKSRRMSTENSPIGGGKGYPANANERAAWIARESQASGLTNAQMDQLFQRYGTLAATIGADIAASHTANAAMPLQHQPTYLRGEVSYLARQEKIVHLEDFILRRSSLGMLGMVTRPLLEELATVIGETMGWQADERQREVAQTITLLARRHRVEL
ncbi:MAG: glycerol-3-phosphate dehydrogenase/oxidase [Caldilineaceae bacterium]